MVETALEKQGRVAVVVPHGVLFRGAAEGRIRQKLIEENLLDAVICLPGNLFPTTNIPVAILVFDRSREQGGEKEARQDVRFKGENHFTGVSKMVKIDSGLKGGTSDYETEELVTLQVRNLQKTILPNSIVLL